MRQRAEEVELNRGLEKLKEQLLSEVQEEQQVAAVVSHATPSHLVTPRRGPPRRINPPLVRTLRRPADTFWAAGLMHPATPGAPAFSFLLREGSLRSRYH